MNKTFFMALMLASGMAFAQSSGSYGSQDQSQPSSQQPSTQPSQPSTQQNPSTGAQSPASSGQSSLTGCLKGSGGSWVIVSEGQSTPVTGDSSTLSPHNGHQVQLKGTQASDGSFQVTDVVMIAESCPSQQSDASSGAAAAAGATAGVVRTVAQTSSGSQSTSPSSTQSTSPASGQSTTQPTTPSTTQGTQPSPSAGQTAPGQTGAAQKKLPQTASPMPLLALLGLGSLATGLIARRRK